ncbi:DUF2461 domain-containing protein [Sinomonas sp. ASV486]|uniref:DUF2461 domain-containing protein n=1 Tax=Sinomonas sp. ASV486 TaxID=3051170 RepID=UPI0027DE21F4|nr:DUF2461 domain-containing protein [Sinomonas sp. ASV486]MDQ4490771.1 DUF2461 domain-containing protein [Sinomonas sp. ASV486]
MNDFQGFPAGGPEFYAELEENNTKEWWTEHKDVYEQSVREPMAALLDELSAEFGEAKAFRPYRDVRFSKDKSPYKTHQGGFAQTVPGIGYYLHLDAEGLTVGGGYHSHTPAQIARFRAAVDAPASGGELERIVGALREGGYEINGERLKTVPREYAKDHPRGELLKHKSLTAGKAFGTPAWLSSPEALERVRASWTELRPVVEWLSEHVGG